MENSAIKAPTTRELEILLSHKDFTVGEDLPWSVYDSQRTLLLPEGAHVKDGTVVDKLLANSPRRYVTVEIEPPEGNLTDAPRSDPRNSFEMIESIMQRMHAAYELLHNDVANQSFTRRIMHLVFDLQGLCEAQPDAMLGTIQLMHDAPHGLAHPLHAAILCEVASSRMGHGPLERFPLVAAALTHDVGMYEIQETLYHQNTPLTNEQHHIIRCHPRRSYELLKKQGITESRWLEPVLHHHERLDGSGYPDSLRGDELTYETRMMAIADCYSAMIRPRAYRTRVLPKAALSELFQERGSTIDGDLASLFVNVLGIFSPGSLVELNNGLIGIVRNRTDNLAAPHVAIVANRKGERLQKARIVATDMPEMSIKGMICPQEHEQLLKNADRIWPSLPALDELF
ncbi:MAG: HD domain-containing protein [Marinobacterium sp.]|nr:HD domain-containing protein [Marinobacterium sp.]